MSPSKRLAEETAFVAAKGLGVTTPQYRCCACDHEFEYDNVNSPDDETPKFCPNCGRRNG